MLFEELHDFHAVHLGLLWLHLGKNRFPRAEEHPPIPISLERFGIPDSTSAPQIQLLNVPPMPRCLFISADGTQIIQVQNDRFTFNWRKLSEDDAYPRFEALFERFEAHAGEFQHFIKANNLGEIRVIQAELVSKRPSSACFTDNSSPMSIYQADQCGGIETIMTGHESFFLVALTAADLRSVGLEIRRTSEGGEGHCEAMGKKTQGISPLYARRSRS